MVLFCNGLTHYRVDNPTQADTGLQHMPEACMSQHKLPGCANANVRPQRARDSFGVISTQGVQDTRTDTAIMLTVAAWEALPAWRLSTHMQHDTAQRGWVTSVHQGRTLNTKPCVYNQPAFTAKLNLHNDAHKQPLGRPQTAGKDPVTLALHQHHSVADS